MAGPCTSRNRHVAQPPLPDWLTMLAPHAVQVGVGPHRMGKLVLST